jgi:beta-glucosidase
MQIQFPSSFLWGAALSSYQCEGQNVNADWHLWEKERNLESCGLACNHYDLFPHDFQLARQLQLNSLRLSLEWARIFPEPSGFCDRGIQHYHQVVDSLLTHDLKPLITLHHFTNPLWFAREGGWMQARNVDHFLAYVRQAVESLKDKVEMWVVLNEPLVYIYNGFIQGIWPPGEKSLFSARKALDNLLAAYYLGYQEIKRIYAQTEKRPAISLAKNLRIFQGCPLSLHMLNSLSAGIRSKCFNFSLLDHLAKKGKLDFLAINYYCKEYTRFEGLVGAECTHRFHGERKNELGWNVYPQGLYEVLMRLKRFNLPVFIAENGTAELGDAEYGSYLLSHLKAMARAYSEGVDVSGYFWWSLLDNFEWDKGFGPRFGLIEVDYKTYSRNIRPFAHTYAGICRQNAIEI